MIFVCTCSQDATVDLLVPHLRDTLLFRFDIDKPRNYTWDFSKSGFRILNLVSHQTITSDTLSSFYLRKPLHLDKVTIPEDGCLENWCREEIDELFRDFYRECEDRHQTILVHSHNAQYGKLRQMLLAEGFFRVSSWHFLQGDLPDELKRGKWVAKTLTGTRIGAKKAFFVKTVDPTTLDLSYPWFLQEKIDGEDEVTVVYANGQLFPYRYPRAAIAASDDVRKATLDDPTQWEPCNLSPSEQSAIRSFMAETGYRFGRFDFIRKDDELWFLELNSNGQWAWLDEDNKNGLISSVADQIIAEDRRHRRSAVALRPLP